MKIIFDCERMKYPYTGLFEYCHKLGTALRQTKAAKDEVALYLRKKDQVYFEKGSEFVNQHGLHKFIFPPLGGKVDIWHAAHQTSWYLPPASRKIKIVLTVHDLNFMHEEKSDVKRNQQLKKHQDTMDKADHIIAISEFTKQDILKYLKVDKPITVIYNGCDFEVYPDYDTPVFRPSKPFLFAIGTIIPKKNFHVLPALLVNSDYELILAGREDAAYVEKIRQEARKYGVESRLHILGPVSQEDKYWYYKNCTAFLFPSLAEGFGIPVIEAMNFGKPVFLSTRTSLPEIGGEHAYYFENFDTENMQKTFSEGMQHYKESNPSAEIIAHAQKFSWENCAEQHWKLYKSLL